MSAPTDARVEAENAIREAWIQGFEEGWDDGHKDTVARGESARQPSARQIIDNHWLGSVYETSSDHREFVDRIAKLDALTPAPSEVEEAETVKWFREHVEWARGRKFEITEEEATTWDRELAEFEDVLALLSLARGGEGEAVATKVSIHGMYDCHLVHRVEGSTVDEVAANWLEHNSKPQPAIVGGEEVADLGPSWLCPAIVLAGKTELRRVGKGVWWKDGASRPGELDAYCAALKADPDISRLLALPTAPLPEEEGHDGE